MAQNAAGGDDDNIDWNTDDDLEIDNYKSSLSSPPLLKEEIDTGLAETNLSSSSPSMEKIDYLVGMGFSEEMIARAIEKIGEDANMDTILDTIVNLSAEAMPGSSKSKVIDHFLGMGFPEELVVKVIQENGEEDSDSILMTLLAYSAIENSPEKQQNHRDDCSSDLEGSFYEEFSDEEMENSSSDEDNKLKFLVKMGYSRDEALIAIERCGSNATVAELTDFICAAQMAKEADALLGEPIEEKPRIGVKKRGMLDNENLERKKLRGFENEDDEPLRLPKPMIGFGVPSEPGLVLHRSIPEVAKGPPYFYYENVALAPKGVWQTISRFLYDVEPEFVDSKHFCAAARKRGYIHNLPIDNRYPLLPLPPRTIHEALPMTRKWWPSWDTRTKLNCLQTCIGSAKLTERIRKALEDHDGVPPLSVQKYVMEQCRKWNLVWVGRNKVAPLEADEIEMLLGFPRNHTRGGGISRTDRYKSLGNSFQVDTVAYHLSVLKDIFPHGLNLLSLFSGIGGAEVALHRLGIPLKTVVSVEISEVNRGIMKSWWEQTNQKGIHIDIADVQELDSEKIESLMDRYGGFDLVVGGSPCNNLAGSNRVSRNGLEGKESSLFFDYFRILGVVKDKMSNLKR